MSNYKVSHLLASTLILAVGGWVNQAFANCSIGAWDGVSGNPQALGASTSPKGDFYEGECGLTVDSASPGYVTTQTPLNETLFTAQFLLDPSAIAIGSGKAIVFQARDGATVQAQLSLVPKDGSTGLAVAYRSGGQLVEHAESFLLQPVWQVFSVLWSAGDGNGQLQLKLDGRNLLALNNLDNTAEVVNEVDLGIVNSPVATGQLAFDSFEMRRTAEFPAFPEATARELFSISTRAKIATGAGATVAGFIIKGTDDKCLVVRGRGPSVGVREDQRLADPELVLKRLSDRATIGYNDDWQVQDNPTHVSIIQNLGMAPSEPKDAALYTCLPEGAYSADLVGKSGTTGVGIVEVVDADTGLPYLGSISTRARVVTGLGVTVAGFIIEGDLPKTIVVRGRGPSVGVREELRLADPKLTLKKLDGTTLAINDNWGDAPNVTEINASGMAPPNPLDAAILIELQPGLYSATLQGVDAVTGIGIVEVIDLSPR